MNRDQIIINREIDKFRATRQTFTPTQIANTRFLEDVPVDLNAHVEGETVKLIHVYPCAGIVGVVIETATRFEWFWVAPTIDYCTTREDAEIAVLEFYAREMGA